MATALESWYIGLTKRGEEEAEENTHSRTIFGQFQTIIKSELNEISIRGKWDPPRIVSIWENMRKIAGRNTISLDSSVCKLFFGKGGGRSRLHDCGYKAILLFLYYIWFQYYCNYSYFTKKNLCLAMKLSLK